MAHPTCTITFGELLVKLPGGKDVRDGLSAAAVVDRTLFLASDEATRIERLTGDATSGFAAHAAFALRDLIGPLPIDDEGKEVDIEGLAIDDGWLWLVGSHSSKREKIDLDDGGDTAANIETLAKIKPKGNRYLLVRIPLEVEGGVATPVAAIGDRRAGRLVPVNDKGGAITSALAADPHIGPFVAIPGKDNGLDLEGLAVSKDRVYLGLRGPVLRGWAVVVELQIAPNPDGSLTLAAPPIKHFLDLDGLGVRDLAADGRDLLVLAGPTMVLDAPEILYRWRGALDAAGSSLTWNTDLELVAVLEPVAVPRSKRTRGGPTSTDHAEGIALVPGSRTALVFYDAPGASHKPDQGGTLTADLVSVLPAAAAQANGEDF